jgi:polyketide cyclase/dehydrase/lipid transport protein
MRRVAPFLLIFFFILCRGVICNAELDKFDFPVEDKKLWKGELQIFERRLEGAGDKKKRHIAGIILIDASTDEVWEVVNNWESMSEFVPDLEYYRVITEGQGNKQDGLHQLFVEGKLNIPLFNFVYNLGVVSDKSRLVQRWRLMTPEEIEIIRLVGVDIKKSTDGIEEIKGYAHVESVDNGRKSIYTYSTTIEFSMPLPEFVENYICRNALSGFMKGIKKRAESHGLYIKDSFSLFPPSYN